VEEVGLWEVLGEAVGNEMLEEEEGVSLIGAVLGRFSFLYHRWWVGMKTENFALVAMKRCFLLLSPIPLGGSRCV
jgi:hypothetical protein